MKPNLLLQLIQSNFSRDVVNISINIDGLSLTKSSSSQFWPILMLIDLLEISEPFIVGIYHGFKKPESVIHFLDAFVKEYLFLLRPGGGGK